MTDVATPPVAGTRHNPAPLRDENRITPLRLHAPPATLLALHSVAGSPPEISTFLSFPGVKKPSHLLSGDQKGQFARSVPGNSFSSPVSSARNQSWILPPVAALKASHFPSGDTATCPKLVFSGGRMEVLKTRESIDGWRLKYDQAKTNAITPSNEAAASNSFSRLSRLVCAGILPARASLNCDPDGVVKASNANPRSLADWNRCPGRFSKHLRTSFSSCGLTFVFVSPSSGGSSLRIAFITSMVETPQKARCPLSIS